MQDPVGKLSHPFWAPERGPYVLLILLAITLFVLAPLLSARLLMPAILEIAFSLIIVLGAFTVSKRAAVRMPAVAVGLLSVLLRLLGMSVTGKVLMALDTLASVGMLTCFAYLMARHFLSMQLATEHRIAGAVAIYLLLGLIWARIYQLAELINPGSFRIHEAESLDSAALTYFSFVTLATLGYGDITPSHILSRDLAVMEAITGQLYLVILISKLVSEGATKSANPP